MLRLATLPLILGASLIATTALAGSATIRYDDLDLTTEAGMSELDKRVNRAAVRMCRDKGLTGTRIPVQSDSPEIKACREGVRAEVMAKLPQARLAKQ
jgi:UrcA family protein